MEPDPFGNSKGIRQRLQLTAVGGVRGKTHVPPPQVQGYFGEIGCDPAENLD
jgi:hypothetical protein